MKKGISATLIASLLFMSIPSSIYALGEDDFLKFLMKSTYPEVSAQNTNNNNTTTQENNNNEDYVKIHIGKDNQPTPEQNSVENNTPEPNIKDVPTVVMTKENPEVFIYHTHGSETYSDAPDDNFHAKEEGKSVIGVGNVLTDELTKRGYGVIHDKTYHDVSYNQSYLRSLQTAQNTLSKHKDVKVIIDLHRDAKDTTTEAAAISANKQGTVTINGEKVAKFMFVIGGKSPNADKTRKFAQFVTDYANKKYPGIALPIVEKSYAKFNSYLSDNYLLLEIGSNATSSSESKATAKYVAEILDGVFKEMPK
jgi:stage II sporulation protein P